MKLNLTRCLCLLLCALSLLSLTACDYCREKRNGNVILPSGEEYAFLCNEGIIYYFGELEHQGYFFGEEKELQHMGLGDPTGMYSLSTTDDIMIRIHPYSEWHAIYRKASLPEFDMTIDNCIRLEFVDGGYPRDASHLTCGEGITDPEVISEFLTDIRSQPAPYEAGLYDMITKPNGLLENCYGYGVVYGFFEEEPNLAVRLYVTSYNDLAYSIDFGFEEYVLPEEWLERLKSNE